MFNSQRDQLNRLIYNISEGDLTKTAESKNKKGNSLLINLNNMILKFRGFIAQIITLTDKTIKYTTGLENDTESIKSFSKDNSVAINNISSDMEKMIANVTRTNDFSEDIVITTQRISEKAKAIKKMQYRNLEAITAGYDSLEILINKIEKTANSSINTSTRIKNLEEKIQLIQSIADKVNMISQSTNILSLNASIEAVHAGVHGKGFSVVATEIRKLAENSTQQSNQIKDIVSSISSEIIDISSNIETEISEVTDYIEVSRNTKQSLLDLKIETKDSFDAFIEIDKHIGQQVDKVNKIGNEINDIHITLKNISESTAEIAASSDEQHKITEYTFEKLSNLKTMNEEIKKIIDSFIKNYKIDEEKKRYINNGIETLKEIANIMEVRAMDYKITTPVLKQLVREYPYFELLGLIHKDGLRRAITLDYIEEQVYVDFSHRPYFKA
jgi:methyl-accepting chemotaxis protein